MTLDRRLSGELARPVGSTDELVGVLRSGEKPPARWRIGVEHEKLGVRPDASAPVPYSESRGVEALLRELARDDGWKPVTEDGHVVALEKDELGVSLEPGGQLELNGAPARAVHEVCVELERHLAVLRRVGAGFDVAWLGLGVQPFHPVAAMPRVPRTRYRIMRHYLPSRGSLGLEMMHATASVQVSIDFSDEADMAAKMRTALAVTPIVAALFANSSLAEGHASGFVSRRLHVWRHTDPDRTGLLPFAFEPGFGYARYVEWALDVPMFFIVRDGRYLPMHGKTFRRFLKEGHEGERPTLADFDRHLTTLFPEVRLKRVLELRCADAVPPDLLCAVPAVWKGLLYDAGAREAAERLGARWSPAEREALMEAVARRGLAAEAPDGRVCDAARELVAIAAQGLARLAERESGSRDERRFLEPLEPFLETGRSPGAVVLERWEGEWRRDPIRLIESARY